MKHAKKTERERKWLLPVIIAVFLTVLGAGGCLVWAGNSPGGVLSGTDATGNTNQTNPAVVPTGTSQPDDKGQITRHTEEEKSYLEQQVGINVNEEGTMEIDLEAILKAEQEYPITRQQAEEQALQQLGGQADNVSTGLREYEGRTYWTVQLEKDGATRDIWIDTETGEELINQ